MTCSLRDGNWETDADRPSTTNESGDQAPPPTTTGLSISLATIAKACRRVLGHAVAGMVDKPKRLLESAETDIILLPRHNRTSRFVLRSSKQGRPHLVSPGNIGVICVERCHPVHEPHLKFVPMI